MNVRTFSSPSYLNSEVPNGETGDPCAKSRIQTAIASFWATSK